tara:strand:- start:22 stop:501 length:480 start_codon:yes stop_codon:yes gene_type:complete
MVATINTPAFAVTKSADQTISDATLTTVTFDTEDFDTDAAFASNKFTCPSDKPGIYLFQCELFVNSSNDINTCELDLYKTPSGGSATNVAATELFDITGSESQASYMARISHTEKMAAGDAMEVKVNSDIASNGDLTVNQSNAATDNRTRFHGFRIAGL